MEHVKSDTLEWYAVNLNHLENRERFRWWYVASEI